MENKKINLVAIADEFTARKEAERKEKVAFSAEAGIVPHCVNCANVGGHCVTVELPYDNFMEYDLTVEYLANRFEHPITCTRLKSKYIVIKW